MTIFHCTRETPWHEGLPTPVRHAEVEEVGEQRDGWPSGDLVTKQCKICGTRWEEELPQ